MDYLYINAIVNEIYTDIPSISDFPRDYRDDVVQISQSLDCLSPNAPDDIFAYYTVKEPDMAPVLVMSRVQRHTNCSSVGRLTQCQGWNFNTDLVLDHMDQIFSTGFYTEAEVDSMARQGGNVPLPVGRTAGAQAEIPVLSVPVKNAILSAVFRRWLRGDPALRIAVPANADYNRYVLAAVQAIYPLFPTAMRLASGFCSFLPDARNCKKAINLGFIPEIMSDSDTLKLDGSNIGGRGTANTSRRTLDRFVEHLSALEPQDLKDYLREINRDLEGNGNPEALAGITAKDYGTLGEVLKLLNLKGSQAEMIPAWIGFYENPDKYPIPSQAQIRSQIQASIQVPEFCQVYAHLCTNAKTEDIFNAMAQLEPIWRENPELMSGLREVLLQALRARSLTNQQIYDTVAGAKLPAMFPREIMNTLYLDAAEEAFQQITHLPISSISEMNLAEQQSGQLLQMIRTEAVPGTEDLQAQLEQHQASLREVRRDAVSKQFLTQLNQMQTTPATTADELNTVIQSARALLEEIRRNPLKDSLTGEIAAVEAFIQEKQQILDSSNVQFRQLLNDLMLTPGYLDRLELAAGRQNAVTEAQQLRELTGVLSSMKPRNPEEFKKQFSSRYHEELTLDAIARRPQLVAAQLIRDISSLQYLSVNLNSRKFSRQQMLESIRCQQTLAKAIRSTCQVQVSYHGFNNMDAKWFTQVLDLRHNVQDTEDHILYDLVAALERDGVFEPDELKEFRKAYPAIWKTEKEKPAGHKKMWIILISCLAALLLVLSGCLTAFLLLRNKPERIEPTAATQAAVQETTQPATQPAETEPPVISEAQTDAFRELLSHGDLIALLYPAAVEEVQPMDLSTRLKGTLTTETDDQLTAAIYDTYQSLDADVKVGEAGSISRDRYIALQYWYYLIQSQQNPEFTWENTAQDMNDLLSLVYYRNEPRADSPEEAKPVENKSPDETGETTAPTTAATEQPVPRDVLLEIMGQEQGAVEADYRASVENTVLLQTWVSLFGTDGSKAFEEHSQVLLSQDGTPATPPEGAEDLVSHLESLGITPWTEESGISREAYYFWASLAAAQDPTAAPQELANMLELLSPCTDTQASSSDNQENTKDSTDTTGEPEAPEAPALTLQDTIEPARKNFEAVRKDYGFSPAEAPVG